MALRAENDKWLYWFDRLRSEEAIKNAANCPVIPIDGLRAMTLDGARTALQEAWSEVFIPGPTDVEMLRLLVDEARAQSQRIYPTFLDYNRQRGGGIQDVSTSYLIRCCTGLAGVRKSSLMKALVRICRVGSDGVFVADGQRLVLHPIRRISIRAHQSVSTVLRSLANPVAVAGRTMKDVGDLIEHVRDWLLATGTAMLVVDEMQFFTQSSTASTKTAQLIMTLASLGFPLVYVANYSLVNKLMQRPHEEKDRLLAHPNVLQPPPADSVIWAKVVAAYLAVSPEHFRLDATADARELHRLTAGLFRILRDLLAEAYRVAVERGARFVTMDDVRLAYRSGQFSSHRRDVEDLASLAVSGLIAERRPDLVCPFAPVVAVPRKSVGIQEQADAMRSVDPPTALVESTVSAAAQKTLKVLREAANRSTDDGAKAKIARLPRRASVSADSLRAGATLLRGPLAKPSAARGKRSPQPSVDGVELDRAKTG